MGLGFGIQDREKTYFWTSVADPYPGSGTFLTPGSGIRDPGWKKVSIRIRDEQPGSYILELKNNFFCFFGGIKTLNSLMRIRDPGWRQFGSWIRDPVSGMEKSRIRDPG